MSRNIRISNDFHRELRLIKDDHYRDTGRDINFEDALHVWKKDKRKKVRGDKWLFPKFK